MGEDGGRGEMQHPGLGRRGPEGEFREACIACPFQGSGAVPRFVPLTEKEVRRKNGSAARGKRVRKRLGWGWAGNTKLPLILAAHYLFLPPGRFWHLWLSFFLLTLSSSWL